jgi:hypothetical protein
MPWTFGPEFAGHPTPVEMRELRGFTPIQRAAAFRARMDSFFFKQVGTIAAKSPWAPFPLAVMTCIGLETIGAYKYGDAPRDDSRHLRSFAEDLHGGFAHKENDPRGNAVTLSTFPVSGIPQLFGAWVLR